MTNVMTPPKQNDPNQQDMPAHRTAPASANQTNAHTRGMVPQHFAAGTADVQPLPAYPIAPATAGDPNNLRPRGAPPVTHSVLPAIFQPSQGDTLAPKSRAMIPLSVPHAAAMFNNAVAGGHQPDPSVAPPQPVTVAARSVAAPTVGQQLQVGTPEHAMANAGSYSPDEFHNAFAGMRRGAFYRLMGSAISAHLPMQEQAANLALAMALQGRGPGAQENYENLVRSGMSFNPMYPMYGAGGTPGYSTPGLGAVDPNAGQ